MMKDHYRLRNCKKYIKMLRIRQCKNLLRKRTNLFVISGILLLLVSDIFVWQEAFINVSSEYESKRLENAECITNVHLHYNIAAYFANLGWD